MGSSYMSTANNNFCISRKNTALLYILMAAILLCFLMTQFLVPSERGITDDETHITYPGIFYWEKEDGSREKIAVPGRYDVAAKETMVISTVLPADFDKTALAIRGSLQDETFYEGDEHHEL